MHIRNLFIFPGSAHLIRYIAVFAVPVSLVFTSFTNDKTTGIFPPTEISSVNAGIIAQHAKYIGVSHPLPDRWDGRYKMTDTLVGIL